MKYLGVTSTSPSKPRGFTVLSVPPEKWADGRRRISVPSTFPESGVGWNSHPNTSLVPVRVGRSTTTRECPSHHVEDTGFQRHHISISCLSQREIKIFHPSFGFADCPNILETWFRNCSDGLHSRGHINISINIKAPRHSPCSACRHTQDSPHSSIRIKTSSLSFSYYQR